MSMFPLGQSQGKTTNKYPRKELMVLKRWLQGFIALRVRGSKEINLLA